MQPRYRDVLEFSSQIWLRQHQVVELFAVEGKKNRGLTRSRGRGSGNVRQKGNLSKEFAVLKNGDLSRCFAESIFENFHCAPHDDVQLVAFVAFLKDDLAGGMALGL